MNDSDQKDRLKMTDQDALRFVFDMAKEHAIDRGRAMY